ncbi:MAG: insulinase family protein, partial [Fidelibacterota bacterium]
VQTDKTRESMVELDREVRDILAVRPATEEELQKAKNSQTLRLPGRFETLAAVEGAIVEMVQFGIPENYYEAYPGRVRELDRDDISAVARKVLHPDKLIWLVVGDRKTVEEGIRDLGFGELEVIKLEDESGV